jgi:Tfp pilus assembly protein PilE
LLGVGVFALLVLLLTDYMVLDDTNVSFASAGDAGNNFDLFHIIWGSVALGLGLILGSLLSRRRPRWARALLGTALAIVAVQILALLMSGDLAEGNPFSTGPGIIALGVWVAIQLVGIPLAISRIRVPRRERRVESIHRPPPPPPPPSPRPVPTQGVSDQSPEANRAEEMPLAEKRGHSMRTLLVVVTLVGILGTAGAVAGVQIVAARRRAENEAYRQRAAAITEEFVAMYVAWYEAASSADADMASLWARTATRAEALLERLEALSVPEPYQDVHAELLGLCTVWVDTSRLFADVLVSNLYGEEFTRWFDENDASEKLASMRDEALETIPRTAEALGVSSAADPLRAIEKQREADAAYRDEVRIIAYQLNYAVVDDYLRVWRDFWMYGDLNTMQNEAAEWANLTHDLFGRVEALRTPAGSEQVTQALRNAVLEWNKYALHLQGMCIDSGSMWAFCDVYLERDPSEVRMNAAAGALDTLNVSVLRELGDPDLLNLLNAQSEFITQDPWWNDSDKTFYWASGSAPREYIDDWSSIAGSWQGSVNDVLIGGYTPPVMVW